MQPSEQKPEALAVSPLVVGIDYSPEALRQTAINLVLSFYLNANPAMGARLNQLVPNLRSLDMRYDAKENTVEFVLRFSDNPNNKKLKCNVAKFGGKLDGHGLELSSVSRLKFIMDLLRKESAVILKLVNNQFTSALFTFAATSSTVRIASAGNVPVLRTFPYYNYGDKNHGL